jgi:Ca-activated chloride channel homolog
MAAGTGSAAGKERNEQALGGFAVPYSAEYLRFRSDPLVLKQIAERTGGRLLDANTADIFHPARTTRESSRPIFDWFLLALCCLIPLDVGIRRVQLDWEAIRGWFRPRQTESTETMGALLARKGQVKEQLDAPRAERPPPIIPTMIVKPATPPPKPVPKPAEAAAQDGEDLPQSTTGRLLARKRKRQEGDQ